MEFLQTSPPLTAFVAGVVIGFLFCLVLVGLLWVSFRQAKESPDSLPKNSSTAFLSDQRKKLPKTS